MVNMCTQNNYYIHIYKDSMYNDSQTYIVHQIGKFITFARTWAEETTFDISLNPQDL